jgi:hypothetical protein
MRELGGTGLRGILNRIRPWNLNRVMPAEEISECSPYRHGRFPSAPDFPGFETIETLLHRLDWVFPIGCSTPDFTPTVFRRQRAPAFPLGKPAHPLRM